MAALTPPGMDQALNPNFLEHLWRSWPGTELLAREALAPHTSHRVTASLVASVARGGPGCAQEGPF